MRQNNTRRADEYKKGDIPLTSSIATFLYSSQSPPHLRGVHSIPLPLDAPIHHPLLVRLIFPTPLMTKRSPIDDTGSSVSSPRGRPQACGPARRRSPPSSSSGERCPAHSWPGGASVASRRRRSEAGRAGRSTGSARIFGVVRHRRERCDARGHNGLPYRCR